MISHYLNCVIVRTKLTASSTAEGTINGLLSEGDNIVQLMRKEVDIAPLKVRGEMHARWSSVNGEWASFKRTWKSSALGYGDPSTSLSPNLVRGTAILERTGASIIRATQVAQESEAIGAEVSPVVACLLH